MARPRDFVSTTIEDIGSAVFALMKSQVKGQYISLCEIAKARSGGVPPGYKISVALFESSAKLVLENLTDNNPLKSALIEYVDEVLEAMRVKAEEGYDGDFFF